MGSVSEISTKCEALAEQEVATRQINESALTGRSNSGQVARNVGTLSKVMQTSSNAADEMLAASGDLRELSGNLQSQMSQFLKTVRSA